MTTSNVDNVMTISKEDMIAGVIYQENKETIDWNNLDDNMRDWVGGEFDSDGCISIDRKHGVRIMMVKAENGWPCLEEHRNIFGGTLYKQKDETEKQQSTKIWSLSGKMAIDFCEVMKAHTFLKSDQLAEASRYPFLELHAMKMKPVAARNMKTQEIRVFASQSAGQRAIGGKLPNIRAVLDKPNLSCAGHRWWSIPNPISVDETQKLAKLIETRVHDLKSVEHLEISRELSAPYCAGFVDGDGTFALYEHKLVISVGQKYRAIADALQRKYAGTIHRRVQRGFVLWTWRLSVKQDCARFLDEVAPYLIEKAAQGKLLLDLCKANCKEIGVELAKHKGRQGKSLKKKILPSNVASSIN